MPHGTPDIFGYQGCLDCGTAVLAEVAWKTGGRCADCFRAKTNPFLDEIVAVTRSGERMSLRIHASKRTPGERAQRRRAKSRARRLPAAKANRRLATLTQTRALRRLRDLFPEMYEVLLADERAKEGLVAWTIDRAVTSHQAAETFDLLATYHRADNPLAS